MLHLRLRDPGHRLSRVAGWPQPESGGANGRLRICTSRTSRYLFYARAHNLSRDPPSRRTQSTSRHPRVLLSLSLVSAGRSTTLSRSTRKRIRTRNPRARRSGRGQQRGTVQGVVHLDPPPPISARPRVESQRYSGVSTAQTHRNEYARRDPLKSTLRRLAAAGGSMTRGRPRRRRTPARATRAARRSSPACCDPSGSGRPPSPISSGICAWTRRRS